MKAQLLILALVAAPSFSFAVPSKNKLISPETVTLTRNGKLKIAFSLPCEYDDSVGFVTTYDDSGDRVVAVGVVYSKGVCRPARLKKFIREIDTEFANESDTAFEPMDVE